jgi:MFS family permease
MASSICNAASSTKTPLCEWLRDQPMLRHFLVIRSIDELNAQMLSVAIAWYVYAATHNPMSLAYVGLARFLPNIGMMLVTGQAADRLDRRWIIGLSTGLQAICAGTFGILLAASSLSVGIVYFLLFVIGAAQAFSAPAMSATLPNLVSGTEFPRAVAVASSALQICSLAGPAIGGLIYGLSGPGMFAFCAVLYLMALTKLPCLADNGRKIRVQETGATDQGALAGIRYVWSNRLLFALISLDLFAVLLGGVTALLPIYAKDILVVGSAGLGFLRCAPGIGAAIVGLFLAHRTIQRGAGKLMLVCVAGFGFAIVVFAFSINLWLSLAALICAGGFDMVSMVVRQTLVQVFTPDAMRGRVSAVQWLFIGASSELGEFESGATAALLGTVHAGLLGGLGTLAVVALWAKIFPELRWADKLAMEDEGASGFG